MAEIVNLRMARKARARAADDSAAATNRARHGRTPVERRRDEAEATRQARLLDGAKLPE